MGGGVTAQKVGCVDGGSGSYAVHDFLEVDAKVCARRGDKCLSMAMYDYYAHGISSSDVDMNMVDPALQKLLSGTVDYDYGDAQSYSYGAAGAVEGEAGADGAAVDADGDGEPDAAAADADADGATGTAER